MYIVSEYKEEFFNFYVIPTLIKKQFKGNINKLRHDKLKLIMEEYILDKYDISFNDILTNLINFISVHEVNGKYIISIDNIRNFPEVDEKFSTITSLIDNGNLEVKGLHLLDSAMRYIQNNIKYIHFMCERGVKIWV